MSPRALIPSLSGLFFLQGGALEVVVKALELGVVVMCDVRAPGTLH